MSYGERFRVCRERAGLTQEQVAQALTYLRGAPVSLLERKTTKVPKPATIRKHAAALNCQPADLLAGVPTDYDRLRTPTPISDADLGTLLWGLAYLPLHDRRVVFETMQAFVDALPPHVKPAPAPTRALGRRRRAARMYPKRKRA